MTSPPLETVLTREALEAHVAAGGMPDYLYFWGHTGQGLGRWVFSQWYPALFEVAGVTYPTAEHWMMAEKARLFSDDTTLGRILSNPDPSAAKAAGRSVQGFDDALWSTRRVEVVRQGSLHKFEQNPEIGAYLQATRGKVLVEASPKDTIWGIGLPADSPDAQNPSAWRGDNLLGFALMWARHELSGA